MDFSDLGKIIARRSIAKTDVQTFTGIDAVALESARQKLRELESGMPRIHQRLLETMDALVTEIVTLRRENLELKRRWLFRVLGDTDELTDPDVPPNESPY